MAKQDFVGQVAHPKALERRSTISDISWELKDLHQKIPEHGQIDILVKTFAARATGITTDRQWKTRARSNHHEKASNISDDDPDKLSVQLRIENELVQRFAFEG
jgi:hypothetical protein